jgi:hypothetical protein
MKFTQQSWEWIFSTKLQRNYSSSFGDETCGRGDDLTIICSFCAFSAKNFAEWDDCGVSEKLAAIFHAEFWTERKKEARCIECDERKRRQRRGKRSGDRGPGVSMRTEWAKKFGPCNSFWQYYIKFRHLYWWGGNKFAEWYFEQNSSWEANVYSAS